MARWLRQSTSVDVPIGPFLDSTDGVTAETALTITQPDIRLKKNAAAWAQKAAAQTLTHEENGYYEVTLDATDTDTLGLLRLAVNESGALPVWEDFLVVPANVWDSYFSTDLLQVDAQQWLGGTIATPTVTGVPEVDITHINGTAEGSTQIRANVIQLGGVTQSLTDLKDFADDGYDPVTNKVQGVVLTDTVTTYTGNTPQTGDSFARLGAPAGASVSADILAIDNLVDDLESRLGTPSDLGSGATVAANLVDIEAQTDDIGVAGAGLTAVPWNAAWDAEVQSEVDDALVAQNLDHLVKIAVDTDFATTVHLNSVIGHLADNGTAATFDRTTDSLEALQGVSPPSAATIADAVWDEAIAGHLGAGSTGEALNAAGAAGDPWVTALPGAYGAGSAGKIVGDNLNATVSSRASQTSVDTIDNLIDTEVAAIKAKTDSLTFTVAGSVDANIQQINDVAITGDGSATPFGV